MHNRISLSFNSISFCILSPENTEARLNVLTEVVEEDGEKFFHVKAVRMHYKLKSVKTKLENLFNGNKELGKFYAATYEFKVITI